MIGLGKEGYFCRLEKNAGFQKDAGLIFFFCASKREGYVFCFAIEKKGQGVFSALEKGAGPIFRIRKRGIALRPPENAMGKH